MLTKIKFFFQTFFLFFLSVTSVHAQWNNPYPERTDQNIYFSAFATPPKTLDPAKAYESDSISFIAQIYEPPLQYDYLKRPYQLVPLTALTLPIIKYFDQGGHELSSQSDSKKIAYTTYDIYIKPHHYYQPHPAFARDKKGKLRYSELSSNELKKIHKITDFHFMGTRELIAEDYVYAIKRLADPTVSSPIFGVMSQRILGLDLLQKYLIKSQQQQGNQEHIKRIDLRKINFEGAKVISKYHYRITIKGLYPQFIYWLSMPFFAPLPWEAIQFYQQPQLIKNNITLNEYPVGTGPYMMHLYNLNKEIILVRNPNFYGETFPISGSISDIKKGYLKNAGKMMPFVDRFIFSLEKESIPRWQKFLQGYYDRSVITKEGFEQAIQLDQNGKPILTRSMENKGIYLNTTIEASDFYLGFNMLDPIVGGYSEKARKLRQAIAIAVNFEEFIAIFLNGRGLIAQGPLPPGVFGYEGGVKAINPYIYNIVNGRAERKSIEEAKKLLTEAGYPQGRNLKTGKALMLNYDAATTGPDDYAEFNWLREQFAKLGIELNVRATMPNRFYDKILHGNGQIFLLGWNADYPDPENFLFLFYGPNSTVLQGGENKTNYQNSETDHLFQEITDLPDGPVRLQKIKEMVKILQQDSPWIWGYHPIGFTLSQQWVNPFKPSSVANNLLKYYSLEPAKRETLQKNWNSLILWPIIVFIFLIILIFLPVLITYYLRENNPNIKRY